MSGENCLTGLKILDLTQFEAGPSCTEALGWLGADVVKVENPGMGDPGRASGRVSGDRDAYYFLQYNSNKRSVAVNLKDPRGLQIVKDLAAKADVMIENFAPGAIERLGLGYDVVKALNEKHPPIDWAMPVDSREEDAGGRRHEPPDRGSDQNRQDRHGTAQVTRWR